MCVRVCFIAWLGGAQVAAHVAKAVAQKAYDAGFATEMPKPYNLLETAKLAMYQPQYKMYR